ncbi:uncharacterized protein LOC109860805 isoform X2 [Pseudomyrmex gracilis]|uniref:uncharacterized protein LOC109860805 isoform X2 n=1 Tax=Pseudomyrmex gracilis TaxID=219809 RepID=UPI00099530CE|nr:uncharacterized protein LOC109860805 isoform X2 [Pseudomyrmex gracilis]
MDFFIILLLCYGISSTNSHNVLYDLKECYRNNNLHDFRLPMNLRVLLDIIRKAENYTYGAMDLRTMSSSLMHRFKLDGIVRSEHIKESEGIIPYKLSRTQSIKYKLIKKMVPGNAQLFPFDALTAIERCTLHQAISNSVMKNKSHGTNAVCMEIGQKLIGRARFADLWNCPQEYGVILTPYGTIAPGAILAAITASLEYQNVTLSLINNWMKSESPNDSPIDNSTNISEEVDFIIPKHKMIRNRSMSYLNSLESKKKLDNVWLATIAGELAEMVVNQGPIVDTDMTIGATGFWNNTMRPNVYYLKSKNDYFDATRAEIVGDIDGLIIAKKIQGWIDEFYSLRLSQILDMYYTDEGITLFNENIRVCDRKKAFSHNVPKTLLDEQTFAASDVLDRFNYHMFRTSEALKRVVDHAVTKFTDYTNNYLLTELLCRGKRHYPRVEAFVVFDGAWTTEYTMDFIAALIDDLDVSVYGSKMGILHGTSGQWLLNVTNSPSLAYYAVSNFTKISWPKRLDFLAVQNTISNYLNKTWKEKWEQHTIGNLAQVLIILTPLAQFSETEQETMLRSLKEIKRLHPDLYFLYHTSEQNSRFFQPFVLSDQDRLIIGPNIDVIVQYLSTLPRTLRPVVPFYKNESLEFQDEIEDYISPTKSITYMIHSQNIDEQKITITASMLGP